MKIINNIILKKIRHIPLKYLILVFAIFGVILLYTFSLYQQPIILTSIASLKDFEGKEVTLSGTILDYSTTNYGSQLITIQSNSTQLTIFSDTILPCRVGDEIKATGTIQEYKNSWELILSNPKAATIISTWKNKTTTIKQIAEHPKDYINIPLNISGYIDILYDNIIYIKDNSSQYTVPLIPPSKSIPKPGDNVYVHAELSYDPTHLRYILTDCKCIKQLHSIQEDEV